MRRPVLRVPVWSSPSACVPDLSTAPAGCEPATPPLLCSHSDNTGSAHAKLIVSMSLQEVVEAEGHLIDSHAMESIFDKVVEFHGRFEVDEFRIGRTNS